MKKCLIFILVLIGILTVSSVAAAEEYPVNPNRNHAEEIHRMIHNRKRLLTAHPVNDDDFVLNVLTTPSYNTPGEFEIVKNVDFGNYRYHITLEDDNLSYDLQLLYSSTTNNQIFTLPAPVYSTDYTLTVVCEDANCVEWTYCLEYKFSLVSDLNHPTLDQKVSSIVSSCRVNGDDWQTALNLHDYLTHNAYYDDSLTIYGPDGVLFRETGVCDSYSKAFYLLMNKAGITCERVISNAMRHAWNRVCIDGIWAQVDVTWDDPNNHEDQIVSGGEKHHFFCVSDAFFMDSKYGHTVHRGYELNHPCNTMEISAIIRLCEEWTYVEVWKSDDHTQTGTYSSLIQSELDQHHASFDIPIFRYLDAGGNRYRDTLEEKYSTFYNGKFYLYAMAQEYNSWYDPEGNALSLSITYIPDSRIFHVETDITPLDLCSAEITLENQEPIIFTGDPIEPSFQVSVNGIFLTPEEDYSIAYLDNIHAGTAQAVFSGKGNNVTGTKQIEFSILPLNLAEAEIEVFPVRCFVYSGYPKCPPIKFLSANLIENEDFELNYESNLNAGNASLTISSKGTNTTGSKIINFSILPSGENVCLLPASIGCLETEAFLGTSFREIILPDKPVTMEADCFKGLTDEAIQITIPNAGSSVDPASFNGLRNLTIIAPASLCINGILVEAYCNENGIWYEKLQ